MILIVDDDPSVSTSLGLLLKQGGRASVAAPGPDEALRLLREQSFDLVLQDMNFSRETSGREGLELLRRIREGHPELPVILITAWGSIALAVEGVKAGASDFITKPWSNAHLLQSVETLLSLPGARSAKGDRRPPSRAALDAEFRFDALVGEDPEFLRVLDLVGRVSPTDASVLITGESGTGKELIAEAIHRNSRRSRRRFVKVNLGGISSTLFESEMFGHVRGAFTDARADRAGRFEAADGGTIFLDEIGELDPSSQVKLLRVLQDRTYEVLGSSTARSVDVRVVSATNRDLAQAVEQGRFREDLLYRLQVVPIHLPPLRERPEDISPLIDDLIERISRERGREVPPVERRVRSVLERHHWPGNVRELENTLQRLALLAGDGPITLEIIGSDDTFRTLVEGPAASEGAAYSFRDAAREQLRKALNAAGGNRERAAKLLGISRATIYRKIKDLEL